MFSFAFCWPWLVHLLGCPGSIMINDACYFQDKQEYKDRRHMLTILEDCLDNTNLHFCKCTVILHAFFSLGLHRYFCSTEVWQLIIKNLNSYTECSNSLWFAYTESDIPLWKYCSPLGKCCQQHFSRSSCHKRDESCI